MTIAFVIRTTFFGEAIIDCEACWDIFQIGFALFCECVKVDETRLSIGRFCDRYGINKVSSYLAWDRRHHLLRIHMLEFFEDF